MKNCLQYNNMVIFFFFFFFSISHDFTIPPVTELQLTTLRINDCRAYEKDRIQIPPTFVYKKIFRSKSDKNLFFSINTLHPNDDIYSQKG